MNLNDAKKRIQAYLSSNKTWPMLVDVQTRSDRSDIIDYFKVGENTFAAIENFCNDDGELKLDELYASVAANTGNTFFTNFTGFLMLRGEAATKSALKTLVTTVVAGHVVLITYQCRNYLRFPDPRISESGRLVIVDGVPDVIPGLCFVDPAISSVFAGCYSGLQKVGGIVENCHKSMAYISTTALKGNFPESVYHISQLNNGYDILVENDRRTSAVPSSFGTPEQWNYALQKMGQDGSWSRLIEEEFGSERDLLGALSSYPKFDNNKKWLYFIALSICGAKNNEYLQMVLNSVSREQDLIRNIVRLILTVDKSNEKFDSLYQQRKVILGELKDCLPEITDYCKVLAAKGEDAAYYLTDLTVLERERVIAWLSAYGKNHDAAKLIAILKRIYPDLASYLAKFRFKNDLLDSYFDAYKYQKITNQILPSFEAVVDEQAARMDFVGALKQRATIVDKLDVSKARAFSSMRSAWSILDSFRKSAKSTVCRQTYPAGVASFPRSHLKTKNLLKRLKPKGVLYRTSKSLMTSNTMVRIILTTKKKKPRFILFASLRSSISF